VGIAQMLPALKSRALEFPAATKEKQVMESRASPSGWTGETPVPPSQVSEKTNGQSF